MCTKVLEIRSSSRTLCEDRGSGVLGRPEASTVLVEVESFGLNATKSKNSQSVLSQECFGVRELATGQCMPRFLVSL